MFVLQKSVIIGVLAMFVLFGCQSRYSNLIVAIESHKEKEIEEILKKGVKEINTEELSPAYYAIKYYGNDKDGLEVLRLLKQYGVDFKGNGLSLLCQKKEEILERTKYFISQGENLHLYWRDCKQNEKVYKTYKLEMQLKEEESEVKKEALIEVKKKPLRKKVVSFMGGGHSAMVTDVSLGVNSEEIIAHSAKVMRINTGTFEFYGIYHISIEGKKFIVDEHTKLYIQDKETRSLLKREESIALFYKTMSKPSSYYTFKWDENNHLTEIRQFYNHIFYSAEDLHRSMR